MTKLPGPFSLSQGPSTAQVSTQPTSPFTLSNTPSQGTVAPSPFALSSGGVSAPVDDKPAFEMVFGFIPTLNVGNILGVENDVARTVTNIVADPFAWLPAIFSGGLTVGAKAASAASRLNSAKGILRLTSKGAGAKGRALNSVANISAAKNAVITSTAALHAPKELLDIAITAANKGDTATYVKTMRQILKSELPKETREALAMTLDDIGNIKDLGKLETRLGKQLDHLAPDIKKKRIDTMLEDSFLRQDRLSQAQFGRSEAGKALGGQEQRSLLRIRAPFSAKDGKTLIHGDRLYKVIDAVTKVDLRLVAGGTSGAKLGDSLLARNNTIREMGDEMVKLKAEWRAEIESLHPGQTETIERLLNFHVEDKGIPMSVLEELGLAGSVNKAKIIKGRTPVRSKKAAFPVGPSLVDNPIDVIGTGEFERVLKENGLLDTLNTFRSHTSHHIEELRLAAVKEGVDVNKLENYVTHFWDMEPDTVIKESKKLKMSGIMLNKRTFQSWVEGMNVKYEPKFPNVFDNVEQYQKQIVNITESRKVVNKLRSKSNMAWVDGHAVRIFESGKNIEKLRKKGVDIDPNFVNLAKEDAGAIKFLEDVGVLSKSAVVKKGKTVKRAGVNEDSRVWVPKAMASQLQILYRAKSQHEVAKAVDGFNAISKIASLSFSLFHAGALTETAIATMGLKGGARAARLGFGIPGISHLLKKTGIAPKASEEMVKEARRAGTVLGVPSDAPIDLMDKVLDKYADLLGPVLGSPLKGLKHVSKFVNESLWQNFHEPLKLFNYESQVAKLRKTPAWKNLSDKEIMEEAAKLTNNAFGGQNWEQMLVNPRMQQMLHWAMLAPDWTISNAKIAGVGTTGLKGLARGVIGKGRNPSEAMVGKYWRNTAVMGFMGMNLLNKSLSGHYMWENPPGKRLDIDMGTLDDKGQPEFMKLGKQMREPFRWLTDPLSIGGGKLAPLNREIIEQLTGHSAGGFPTDFAGGPGKKPMPFIETIPDRVLNTLSKFKPFSLNGKSVLFAFPRSSLTPFKIEEALIDTLGRGKIKSLGVAAGVMDPKSKKIKDILTIARSAGMDVNRIMGNVKRKVGDEAQILERFKQGTVR